ncbi:UDP-N-acetylmuramoyl-L-alanine--D-glutamate ligase [Patescibacteria group bacterium]|nr:UDP-N-acetylmuramoyl-L-alanine--D-glutamate ligase [Patescibacteria group bacterium]
MKNELIKILENKKIAILGLGLENQALLKYIKKVNLEFNITICDFRAQTEINDKLEKVNLDTQDYKYQLQADFNVNLDKYDIMFRSPGWSLSCPGIKSAKKAKVEISSAMNLFFQLCPSENIIAVTGSKGKGTTATLITEILKNNKKIVHLGGNIGIAPFDFIENIKKDDYIVLELSSFQLEDLKYSSKYSIITNIYHEHLSPADPHNPNYHHSYKDYLLAKANIFKHKKYNNYLITKGNVILEYKKNTPEILKKYHGEIIEYKKAKVQTKLKGIYNQENIGASLKLAETLNLNKEKTLETVRDFKNLENRLEFVAEKKGVKYFNNSFSTTPESTKLDLKSFSEDIILIAGGPDKGADFSSLTKNFKDKVKKTILFPGQGSKKIKESLLKNNYNNNNIIEVESMSEAVNLAQKNAKKNDVVLLSPACASFGLFKNYKERGKLFKKEINK